VPAEISEIQSEQPAVTDETEQFDEPAAQSTPPADEPAKADDAVESGTPAEQPAAKDETATAPRVSPPIQPDVTPYDPTRELETSNGRPEPLGDPGETHSVETSIVYEVVDTGKRNGFIYHIMDGQITQISCLESTHNVFHA